MNFSLIKICNLIESYFLCTSLYLQDLELFCRETEKRHNMGQPLGIVKVKTWLDPMFWQIYQKLMLSGFLSSGNLCLINFSFFYTIGLTNLSNLWSDIVPRVFAIIQSTDLIKGQQHFTVIQIARQDRGFWITVT